MRSVLLFSLFSLLLVPAACGGTIESGVLVGVIDGGDGATATDGSCTSSIDEYCAQASCPANISDMNSWIDRECASFPTAAAHVNSCDSYDTLDFGDGFIGRTFFFEPTSGRLVAATARSDTRGVYCLGGPTNFAVVSGCPRSQPSVTCSLVFQDASAEPDAH
jgi:hypothetical protein